MKVLVVGGCGFIGSNLVESLLKDCSSVMVFGNLYSGNLRNIESLDRLNPRLGIELLFARNK